MYNLCCYLLCYLPFFYIVTGCPELSRPAHAWYKREGNEAVIGCETNEQEWRLTCAGNTWIGNMGNCTVEGIHYKQVNISSPICTLSKWVNLV